MILARADAPLLRIDQLQRALVRALPSATIATAGGVPLELSPTTDPPAIGRSEPLEAPRPAGRTVAGAPVQRFAAFLDGTQRTDVVGHTIDGESILLGTVGAVIRAWTDGRAATWRRGLEQCLYAPCGIMGADGAALQSLPLRVFDTAPGDVGEEQHPHARRDAALKAVRRHRERLETELLRAWLESESRPLYVDGGLSGSVVFAHAAHAVGVVKSHHTLYAEGVSRRAVLGLQEGERGHAFVIGRESVTPLASWYLRLHDPASHDPFWGLVRVEIPHDPRRDPSELTAAVDEISRRVLAEREPTAHPDARWHTMAYGIRDCEVYLRATQ